MAHYRFKKWSTGNQLVIALSEGEFPLPAGKLGVTLVV